MYKHAALLIAIAAATASAQTVIDFDTLAGGTVVTNQYPGVTFSSSAGNQNYAISRPGSANTAPNILCSGPVGGLDCLQDTYIDFATPVNNLTFWAIEANVVGVTAQFNVYENSVFSSTVNLNSSGGKGNQEFVDLSSFNNVTRVEIVNILNDPINEQGIGWDTFRYYSVPSPSGLAALAIGGLFATRRRRPTHA
jgi:MYXO-CTERM domain-containing protein